MTANATMASGSGEGASKGHCHCLEPRLVLLETKVDHVEQSVDRLRADSREQLRWGMAATALLFASIVSSYLLVNARMDLITAEAAKSAVAMQKVADDLAAIKLALSPQQQPRQAPRP